MCWPQVGRGRERRRRSSNCTGLATSVKRRAVAAVDLGQVAVGERLRIVGQLARALHRRPHALDVRERVAPLGERARREDARRARARTRSRFSKRALPSAKRGSADQVGAAEVAAEVGPEAIRLQHVEEEPAAVLGAVAVDDRVRRLGAVEGGQLHARVSFVATMSGARIHIAVPSSETSTTRRLAGALAPEERGRDAAGDRHAADRVAEGGALHDRRRRAGAA